MSRVEPRRRFFRSFLAEMAGFADEVRGRPQYRLDELAELPAEALRAMRPVMIEGCRMEQGKLVGPSREGPVAIRQLDGIEEWIVARFNGRQTIGEIGRSAELEIGLEPEEAQRRVRDLFVVLAKRAACAPAAVPDDDR